MAQVKGIDSLSDERDSHCGGALADVLSRASAPGYFGNSHQARVEVVFDRGVVDDMLGPQACLNALDVLLLAVIKRR